MIKGLNEYLDADRIEYHSFLSKEYLLDYLLRSEQYWIKAYLKALRKEEYYIFHHPNKLLRYYYLGRKNRLGRKLGFFINVRNFGPGLKIYHLGSIIIHPKARIGRNCTLHGNCCVGSKGGYPDDSPVIGDDVDIGQNAVVLGNIEIADGVKIGAGAIVTKSILEPNVTVVGVPAKIVKTF